MEDRQDRLTAALLLPTAGRRLRRLMEDRQDRQDLLLMAAPLRLLLTLRPLQDRPLHTADRQHCLRCTVASPLLLLRDPLMAVRRQLLPTVAPLLLLFRRCLPMADRHHLLLMEDHRHLLLLLTEAHLLLLLTLLLLPLLLPMVVRQQLLLMEHLLLPTAAALLFLLRHPLPTANLQNCHHTAEQQQQHQLLPHTAPFLHPLTKYHLRRPRLHTADRRLLTNHLRPRKAPTAPHHHRQQQATDHQQPLPVTVDLPAVDTPALSRRAAAAADTARTRRLSPSKLPIR